MQDNQYEEKDDFDIPFQYCRNREIMHESKVGPWRTNRKFTHQARYYSINLNEKNFRLSKSETEPKMKRQKIQKSLVKQKQYLKIKPTEKELQFSVLRIRKKLPTINSSSFRFQTEAISEYFQDKNYWQPHSLVYLNKYIDSNQPQKTRRDRNLLNKIPLIKELNFIRVKKKNTENKSNKFSTKSKQKELNKSFKLEPIQIFM